MRGWTRTAAAPVMALLLALLLAWWATSPGLPRAADADPAGFSAGRAMHDVEAIGRVPHVVGTAADRAVTAYLAHRLAGLGLAVAVQPVPLDAEARARLGRWSGAAVPEDARGTSVLGLLPGRDRVAPAIVLMAHHDTVWGSPGAADDTVGVAAILETVRALRRGPQPARDVVVLFTDGEEAGLQGAKAFFDAPASRGHVGVVINLEARGAGGRALMFETGRGNGAMMRAFAGAVPWPSAMSLSVMVYRLLPNKTDLTEALAHDLPGFNVAIAGRAGLYHSPLATPERLDWGSLQDMGRTALALTRALAAAPTLPPRAPDLVFADLWGSRLILYPAWGGWLLLAASVALAGAAAWWRRRGVMREGVGGLLVPLVLALGAGVALFVVNRVSGAGAGANYYDRLAAIPRLEWQAGLICTGALLLAAAWRRATFWGGWLGLFAVLAAIGIAVQAIAPAAGPIVHWPLLLAGMQMAAVAWLGSRNASDFGGGDRLRDPGLRRSTAEMGALHVLAPVALLAAAGIGQMLAIGHLIFTMLGAGSPEAMLVVLLPVALLAWPLLHGLIPPRATIAVATAMLVAAVVLALSVRLDPIAPSTAVYSVDKK